MLLSAEEVELILFGISVVMGVVLVVFFEFVKSTSVSKIANIKQDRGGVYVTVKRVSVPVGAQVFNVGERQFIVDTAALSGYEKWNSFDRGTHPTMDYDLDDSRPMTKKHGKVTQEAVKGRPMVIKYGRTPCPQSATQNLIIRRGGLKAMMMSTKSTNMDPKLVAIMVGIAAFSIGFLIMYVIHPGMVAAPPLGYHYTVTPNPVQTVTTK